jgi:general secretion pathway protein H
MTLVEMLVVLAIIGVMASAAALGLGAATRGPSVEAEARRLANRLQSVADEAMVDDRPRAVTWDDRSYAFLSWDGRGWREGADESHGRHRLPGSIRMDMGNRRPPLVVGVDGGGMPAAMAVRAESDRWMIIYDGLSVTPLPAPVS